MAEIQKLGSFRKSWLLTKAAWNGLRLDKELLALPIIGIALSFALLAACALGVVAAPHGVFYNGTSIFNTSVYSGSLHITTLGYVAITAVSLALSIISTFIYGALIHGALERFNGGDPTISSSLRAARKRFGSLAAFSTFSFTIGYVLSAIVERVPFIGARIVVWLADAAWNVASFFAVPVIVSSDEAVNPIQATKQSISLIRKTWGESLVASAAIGLTVLLGMLLYFALSAAIIIVGAQLHTPTLIMFIVGAVLILGAFGIALIFNVLSAFVKAALYHYATTGTSPVTFNQELLRQSFTTKKARKIFA